MHALYCLSRPMRVSPATAKFKPPQPDLLLTSTSAPSACPAPATPAPRRSPPPSLTSSNSRVCSRPLRSRRARRRGEGVRRPGTPTAYDNGSGMGTTRPGWSTFRCTMRRRGRFPSSTSSSNDKSSASPRSSSSSHPLMNGPGTPDPRTPIGSSSRPYNTTVFVGRSGPVGRIVGAGRRMRSGRLRRCRCFPCVGVGFG
ncbi:hypothetical protein K438DRAFT_343037 [Mycena galopus ATCC 62051]|nr:hypothetical protein K438DRAFT_343037 [Mycena galopus ATCC 62051]